MEWAVLFIDPETIIQFMDSLLERVFQVTESPQLQNWSQGVIENMADKTESQVINQLGYDPTK